MIQFSLSSVRSIAGVCFLILVGSCAGPDSAKESSNTDLPSNLSSAHVAQAVRAPWTEEFREGGLLIADRVWIEGPVGLLQHVATRSVEEYHSYKAETLPEGFRQTYRVRHPEQGMEMRVFLDALKIVVLRELVLTEKPGPLDVHVRAQGDAYWQDPATGAEQRNFEINFVGPVDHSQ